MNSADSTPMRDRSERPVAQIPLKSVSVTSKGARMGTPVRAAAIAGALLMVMMARPVAAQPPEIQSVATNYETETLAIKGLRFGTTPTVEIGGSSVAIV